LIHLASCYDGRLPFCADKCCSTGESKKGHPAHRRLRYGRDAHRGMRWRGRSEGRPLSRVQAMGRRQGMPRGGRSKTQDVAKATNRAPAARTRKKTVAGTNDGSGIFDAEKFITTFGTGRSSAVYKTKNFIFRQGARCDAVFYIQRGQIQLTVVSEQGKERVVGILGPGAFIGEGCLAGHPVYLASARALMESTVVRVEMDVMREAINTHSEMSKMFMEFLLLRNSQIESDLVDQLFNSTEKRLARLLIMLAQVGVEAKMQTIPAPLSQEVLAARVGTTRPRINYFLNKFRKLGFIEYNGVLKVHSSLLDVVIRE
jgi:CRP/FNR family transcriptional regulator, cyclic AMP receptor protein